MDGRAFVTLLISEGGFFFLQFLTMTKKMYHKPDISDECFSQYVTRNSLFILGKAEEISAKSIHAP